MSYPTTDDLNRWLQQAMLGLSGEVQQRIREELEDHYLSSLSHHQHEGESDMEARQNALIELGDAKDAQRAFHDAHGSKWQYLLAGILSMVIPLILAVTLLVEPEYLFREGPSMSSLVGIWYLLMFLPVVLPVLYVIYCGYGLLKYRFHLTLERWRIGLFVAGMLVFCLPDCLDGLWIIVTGHAFFTEPYMAGVLTVQQVVGFAGSFLISAGLLAMSYRIRHLPFSLYGMRVALIVSASIWGFSQVCMTLLNVFPDLAASTTQVFFLGVALPLMTFCVCLGWMFIKAAFMGQIPLPIPDIRRTDAVV
ncbi:MAG: hypothetical protein JXB07_02435 [Anaerolineae bacterium]|nr:hypothetical protein [Anaerolineae bacterium]